MPIEVVIPLPERRLITATAKLARRPARDGGGQRLIGLVNNGKHRADDILEAVADQLVERGLADGHFVHTKPTASHTITEEERAELLARSRIVLTGVGD